MTEIEQMVFGPIPLVLGVVGHRTLPNPIEDLRRVVRELLESFRKKYPSTPIALLCSLAEGADRLAAREALECGFSLVVPLPMPLEEYEKDFLTEGSRAEFRNLLARATAVFVVPGAEPEPGTRTEAYARCGAFIVRHCVELIALWDGKSSPKDGTATVVGYQLDGIPASFVPESLAFEPSLCGPVLHINTPRGDTSGSADGFAVTAHFPRAASDAPKSFARAKYDIDRFNRDASLGPFAERVRALPVREQAERLANAYQKRTLAAQVGISISAFLAIVAFNLYSTFGGTSLALFLAYIVFTAAAFLPYVIYKRGEWQLRYQDYRTLELLLSIHGYWQLGGIDRSVASQFLKGQRTKIDWIPIALRTLTEPPVPSGVRRPRELSREALQAVYENWVLAQLRYFTSVAGGRENARDRASTRIVVIFIVFSIALTIGSRLGISLHVVASATNVLFGATLLAIAAAVIHDFADKRGWSEHARHYEIMAKVFGYAADRIRPLLDSTQLDALEVREARSVLTMLGDEAIRETVAWLNLHRSRPLNVPHI